MPSCLLGAGARFSLPTTVSVWLILHYFPLFLFVAHGGGFPPHETRVPLLADRVANGSGRERDRMREAMSPPPPSRSGELRPPRGTPASRRRGSLCTPCPGAGYLTCAALPAGPLPPPCPQVPPLATCCAAPVPSRREQGVGTSAAPAGPRPAAAGECPALSPWGVLGFVAAVVPEAWV